MPLDREVDSSPGDTVLDGDSAPPQRVTAPPQFSAHVCCGQMAGWIKMPLGTRRHCVSSPRTQLPQRDKPPNFRLMSVVAGWIKMPVGTKLGLGPGHIVLDGYPAPLPKGAQQPPLLSAPVYCSQTVAHLSYCCALV